jgi:hypothetical protein
MNSNPQINWIELALSDRWPRAVAEKLAVHPVAPGTRGGCFAIAVDGRWLSGCDGSVSCFDSKEAIGRFLELLNMPGTFDGTVNDAIELDGSALQCFQLNECGIARCDRCHSRGKRSVS